MTQTTLGITLNPYPYPILPPHFFTAPNHDLLSWPHPIHDQRTTRSLAHCHACGQDVPIADALAHVADPSHAAVLAAATATPDTEPAPVMRASRDLSGNPATALHCVICQLHICYLPDANNEAVVGAWQGHCDSDYHQHCLSGANSKDLVDSAPWGPPYEDVDEAMARVVERLPVAALGVRVRGDAGVWLEGS